MQPSHSTPDNDRPSRPTAPGCDGHGEPASGTADLIEQRQLEEAVSWTGRERLRCLWYRLRLTVQEMNYATRRIVELQAPWISEEHPR